MLSTDKIIIMNITCRLVFGLHLVFNLVHVTYEACSPNCGSCIHRMNNYLCTQCANGYFGNKCSNKCSSTCKDGDCYDYSGHCKACHVGWYGSLCDKRCQSGCKWDICLYHSGHCQECKDGRHGSFCEKTCAQCYNGKCDRKAGICTKLHANVEPKSSKPVEDHHVDENNSNVFVYSFVSVMVIGILIGSACAANKKMKDRQKTERSFSEAKAEMLIQEDQPNDQGTLYPVRSYTNLCANNQRMRRSSRPKVYVTEPSPKPSTSSYRRRSSAEPLVITSDPSVDNTDECLRNEDYFVPTSNDVCNTGPSTNRYLDVDSSSDRGWDHGYSSIQTDDFDSYRNPNANMFHEVITDITKDMSCVPFPDQATSQKKTIPRAPPPNYETLFPSS